MDLVDISLGKFQGPQQPYTHFSSKKNIDVITQKYGADTNHRKYCTLE